MHWVANLGQEAYAEVKDSGDKAHGNKGMASQLKASIGRRTAVTMITYKEPYKKGKLHDSKAYTNRACIKHIVRKHTPHMLMNA